MRKIDFMLILVSLFVLRVIAFSAGFADALCLVAVLSFILAKEYLRGKKIQSEVMVKIESQDARITQMSEEINRVRVSSDGLKAAINLTSKR